MLMFLSPSQREALTAPSSEGAGFYTQVENMPPSDEGGGSALRAETEGEIFKSRRQALPYCSGSPRGTLTAWGKGGTALADAQGLACEDPGISRAVPTYKAGRLSTTGSATKKRGVKNEKCHAFDALLRGASAWPLGTL